VPARQAFDVAFDADAIVAGDENQAENFDGTRRDDCRAEQACGPEPEVCRLRGRQIAEE
jgi:hypothetical protein